MRKKAGAGSEEPGGAARIIVALDVDSRRAAIRLVRKLRGSVGLFKVGGQLYMAAGPAIVREIVESGEKVFLDLKFHDIPNTVAHAAIEAAKLGVTMMTVHASGGRAMLQTTMEALEKKFAARRPWVLGVTVLTSMTGAALGAIGIARPVSAQVKLLASVAEKSGLDGLVCSPHEVTLLRGLLKRPLKLITPGIRMPGDSFGDQARVATPGAAVRAGADYLVIGRSIIEAPDPSKAVTRIVADMERGGDRSL